MEETSKEAAEPKVENPGAEIPEGKTTVPEGSQGVPETKPVREEDFTVPSVNEILTKKPGGNEPLDIEGIISAHMVQVDAKNVFQEPTAEALAEMSEIEKSLLGVRRDISQIRGDQLKNSERENLRRMLTNVNEVAAKNGIPPKKLLDYMNNNGVYDPATAVKAINYDHDIQSAYRKGAEDYANKKIVIAPSVKTIPGGTPPTTTKKFKADSQDMRDHLIDVYNAARRSAE